MGDIRIRQNLAQQERDDSAGLDLDTVEFGTSGPFAPWEADHTALVHVLWHAKHSNLDLVNDADKIADLIRRSRWFAAVRDAEHGD
jgi:hypothetical protein